MSNKLKGDKYYTPIRVARDCIDRAYSIIGSSNITEVIEPSAGNGSFSNQIDNCIAYDIDPDNDDIIKQDFLSIDMDYKKGRLIIGNPPFGDRNNGSIAFFKKSIELAQYIAFIQPISQLNNNRTMYQYDLIDSTDIGYILFSDLKTVHCCFNIWKRPDNGVLNKPPKAKIDGIEMKEVRKSRKQFLPDDYDYDIGICTWGSVGKEVEYQGQYNQELYIKVKNENIRDEVIYLLKNAKWEDIYHMTKSPRLKQWQVIKYIKDNIDI